MTPFDTQDFPLALAVEKFGGEVMKPTSEAMRIAGFPATSQPALTLRRKAGTLPVAELQIGSRYFVTAAAFADAFLRSSRTPPPAPPPSPKRRGPGRPPKTALNIAGVSP